MARLLNDNSRTVRRWIAEGNVPEWVEEELMKRERSENTVSTPADGLIVAGRALFEDRWQTNLAEALGVNDRTVRYWAPGEREPDANIAADFLLLIERRVSELAEVKKILRTQSKNKKPQE